MFMSDVCGHNDIKIMLEKLIKDKRVGHAYIFEGNEGIGRLSLAKAFARAITGGASVLNNPDICIVTNDLYDPLKKQSNVLIETIRQMKADVYIKPYLSEKKVYIIPNADSMLAPAQNSLLKVFEEPPEYCTIILIVKNANLLLQTIRSRATIIRLKPLEKEEVKSYLINNLFDEKKAEEIACLSGGSIGRALALSEDEEAIELRQHTIKHLMMLLDTKNKAVYDFVKFLKQNKSSYQLILDVIWGFSRDVLNIKLNSSCIENKDVEDEVKKFARSITKEASFKFNEITAKYMQAISMNANYPIAVLCMVTEYWEEIHGRNYRSAF